MADTHLASLKNSLIFLHVGELKELASNLTLMDKGKKMAIIIRILHFLQTGDRLTTPKFPENSYAKRGQLYPITLKARMLKGSYKNDLKTRLFFKEIIGDHFHFTAFGIDWLNERWMEGNPPIYEQFANMWEAEYKKRKEMPTSPKEEWAYINFTQDYLRRFPNSSREAINKAWENEREQHKKVVTEMYMTLKSHPALETQIH